MKRSVILLAAAFLAAGVLFLGLEIAVWAMGKSADAPRMTTEELRSRLGSPEVVVLDVRTGDEWTNSKEKIQGALREDPEKYNQWAAKYPQEKTLVFY